MSEKTIGDVYRLVTFLGAAIMGIQMLALSAILDGSGSSVWASGVLGLSGVVAISLSFSVWSDGPNRRFWKSLGTNYEDFEAGDSA